MRTHHVSLPPMAVAIEIRAEAFPYCSFGVYHTSAVPTSERVILAPDPEKSLAIACRWLQPPSCLYKERDRLGLVWNA